MKSHRPRVGHLALALLALLAAGCAAAGGRPPQPPNPGGSLAADSATPSGAVVSSAVGVTGSPSELGGLGEASAEAQQRWDAVVAAARQEGKVVMAVPAEGADEYRGVLRAVGARYGFEVEGRAINASEVSQVLMRECGVGRQTLDVVQGGLSESFDVYPQGCLAPLKPQLILPEVI